MIISEGQLVFLVIGAACGIVSVGIHIIQICIMDFGSFNERVLKVVDKAFEDGHGKHPNSTLSVLVDPYSEEITVWKDFNKTDMKVCENRAVTFEALLDYLKIEPIFPSNNVVFRKKKER